MHKGTLYFFNVGPPKESVRGAKCSLTNLLWAAFVYCINTHLCRETLRGSIQI